MPATTTSTCAVGLELCAEERRAYAQLAPLPAIPPPDPTNRYADDPAAARLGQRLYFDRDYAGAVEVPSSGYGGVYGMSCETCHVGPAMVARRDGVRGGAYGSRDILSPLNSSHYRWTNWGGRFAAQWELPLAVAENPRSLNSTRLRVAHTIYRKYRADYEAVFGPLPAGLSDTVRFPATGKPKEAGAPDGAWEAMNDADRDVVNRIFVNYGKAIAAYMRRLRSGDSPFDRYLGGDCGALSDAARRGLHLFIGKARCVTCHYGPMLTDNAFHNLGAVRPGQDSGRMQDIPPLLRSPFNVDSVWSDHRATGWLAGLTDPPAPATAGQFRTPSLRNVGISAPYMHDGALTTLESVVDFHASGGGPPVLGEKTSLLSPVTLSSSERADLRAFLESLTGQPPSPEWLRDTSLPATPR